MAEETQPDTTPPAGSVQEGGVSIGENAQITVGSGDVTGGDKITAGGHVIQAAAGATVIIGAPAAAPDAVGEGLAALHELMERSSDVRNAVIAFGTDFTAARDQVDMLGDYKDLHDLLHRLQFHCYSGITQAAARFPDDEMALDNLTDYLLTLEGIVAELRQVAERPSAPKQDVQWIEEVALARADLSTAIEKLDAKQLKQVTWRLNRLLSVQPSRINTLLNQAARAMRLPALVQTLSQVSENLASLDLDAEKVGQFKTGVEALSNLDHALIALVDEHDHWQDIDVELRRLEAAIEQDLEELEMSWPDLKTKATPLYDGLTDEWAVAIKKEGDGLDETLAANNPVKVKRTFRSYRRRAGDRFYRVDVDLKTLCGELRKIGAPLASVLGMIE
ncbi:MAG: hypothetical protein HYZ49_19585 [Chloroflexi bacterium]|nr:hypothetical protein [Chloroflexota bacterium]